MPKNRIRAEPAHAKVADDELQVSGDLAMSSKFEVYRVLREFPCSDRR